MCQDKGDIYLVAAMDLHSCQLMTFVTIPLILFCIPDHFFQSWDGLTDGSKPLYLCFPAEKKCHLKYLHIHVQSIRLERHTTQNKAKIIEKIMQVISKKATLSSFFFDIRQNRTLH